KSTAKSAGADIPVKVTLEATADVSARDVCIADVATLEGGTPELRDWIGKLDIADPPKVGQANRITRQQIAFRIRLAGLDDRLVVLDGARDVRVSPASYEVTEAEIFAAAQKFVRARLPWDDDDVVIQPT